MSLDAFGPEKLSDQRTRIGGTVHIAGTVLAKKKKDFLIARLSA